MRTLRMMLAGLAILALGSTMTPARAAREAASTYPKTDFTLVTPQTAILFASYQPTSARQATVLSTISGSLGAHALPVLQTVLGLTMGSTSALSGTGSLNQGSVQQVATFLGGALGRIFDGEFGVAVLPLTLSPGSGGSIPIPHLHLAVDAGLQPGVTQGTLLFATQALGLSSGAHTTYQGYSVVTIDLNVLARALGGATGNTAISTGTLIPANGPISNLFYITVLGDTAVLASDMPTLTAVIDTYRHAQPSITATNAYGEAVGLLPGDRFVTIYAHLRGDTIVQLLQSLGAGVSLLPAALDNADSGMAIGLTAETHGLLLTTSTPPSLQATAFTIPGL